jgi:integrase
VSYITKRPDRPLPFVAEITDPKKPGKVDHTKSFRTRKEAAAYIAQQDDTKRTGKFVSPSAGRVTVDERWETWWPSIVHLRPSSHARDEAYWRSQVKPHFVGVAIGDIDHDMVAAWVARLVELGYAPSTVHKAHGILSKLLKGCIKQGLLGTNVCELTELPEIVIDEQMFLSYEQVEELIAEIDPRFALAVRLASYTGLRAGELFGLPVRNVKVADNYILVAQKLTEVSGKLYITPYLKTENRNARHFGGWRQISVPPALMVMIAEWIKGRDPDDMVFTATKGGLVRLSTWRRRIWYPACIEAGFGSISPCTLTGGPDEPGECEFKHYRNTPSAEGHFDGLRLHDLRHTAVSFWIDQKRSMFEITKMLGQKDSDLVDRRSTRGCSPPWGRRARRT